jgi:hypothetical protein
MGAFHLLKTSRFVIPAKVMVYAFTGVIPAIAKPAFMQMGERQPSSAGSQSK